MRRLASAALAVLIAACGPTGPSAPTIAPTDTPASPPSPSGSADASASAGDPSAIYAAVATQVEQIRHLQPTADVAPVVIDQATLSANLTADFDQSNPTKAVEISQRELIALGLLPPGTSLRAAVLDLQSGQVAGYYSPEKNELFVVSRAGGVGATQRVTYAHEFTHQLQDQHFDLDKLDLDATDQGDRSLGRLSLVEGDAVSVQNTYTFSLSQEDLSQIVADAFDPAGLAALNRAPAILQQTTLFPYTGGLQLVQTLMTRGGYDEVDRAFANPPASTEQVMHPEKFLSHEVPAVVTPAADLAKHLGSGWSETARDTLGELVLKVWLQQGGVDPATDTAGAAGWGGDRLVLFTGPNGDTALVLETTWDTATDATEFAAAARTAIAGLGLHGAVAGAPTKTVFIDKTVSIALGPAGTDLVPLLAALPG
jgi:hypothetical protein